MDELKEVVSKNIIYLRSSLKMTQLQLGAALNYSDKAVSKWERAEAIPDAYVLKDLSRIFGVTVDYLLTSHDPNEVKKVVKNRLTSKNIIILISFLGVWTLGLAIFVTLWVVGRFIWLVPILTLPVSLIVLIVLTAVLGKRTNNIYFISSLLWSCIAALYLAFLSHNWWFLFLIGLPTQIIILLSFMIKRRKK